MKKDTAVAPTHVFFLVTVFYLQGFLRAGAADRLAMGWMVWLALGALSVLITALILHLAGNMTGQMLFPDILGRQAGALASATLSVYGAVLAAGAIRSFADFMIVNELNAAGRLGNAILIGCAAFVLLGRNATLFRTAWMFQPLITGALLLSVCFTLPHARLENLPPLMIEKGPELLQAGAKEMLRFLPPVIYPLLAVSGRGRGSVKKAALLAGPAAFLLLAVLHIRNIAVLGYPTVTIFRYPAYVAAGIRRHSEALVSSSFALCQVFFAAACLQFVTDRLENRVFRKPAAGAAASCLAAFAVSFIPDGIGESLRLIFGAAVLLLLLLADTVRLLHTRRNRHGM